MQSQQWSCTHPLLCAYRVQPDWDMVLGFPFSGLPHVSGIYFYRESIVFSFWDSSQVREVLNFVYFCFTFLILFSLFLLYIYIICFFNIWLSAFLMFASQKKEKPDYWIQLCQKQHFSYPKGNDKTILFCYCNGRKYSFSHCPSLVILIDFDAGN